MRLGQGRRLLFVGDSVTDCGRLRPIGRGSRHALGDGYVSQVDAALRALHPDPSIEVANMGVSGDMIRDLANRWERDVLEFRADWLSVMIGVNDVWRQFDASRSETAVLPEEFEDTFERLLTRTVPELEGVVLMTPFFVQDQKSDPMRERIDAYGALVRGLAERHGALLVDTQAAFDRALNDCDFSALSADRVHPTERGHAVLAHAFLAAVGAGSR